MSIAASTAAPAQAPTGAVAVLSVDNELLTTVRRATAAEHEVVAVARTADLPAQLIDKRIGAVLIDSDAIPEPIDQFVERLKGQFPDLVLVVAGGPADQTALSKHITSNVVYRFLHRPVSQERARLFLEAALRRHDVEHAELAELPRTPAASIESNPSRRSPNLLWVGAVAAVLVASIGVWLATRSAPEPAPEAPPPAPVDAAAVQANQIVGLLAAGDAAYVKGEYLTPAAAGAADRYRAVLALDPNNGKARAGIDRVVDKLLSAAEAALLAEQPDQAQEQIDLAISLAPSSSRAAFLAVQVGKERERGALTETQDAGRGPASEQAAGFLRLANQRVASGGLIDPPQDNARFYLEAARRASPSEPGVARTARALQNAMLERATAAASRGDLADAERWLANAEEARASRAALAEVRRTLQQAEVTNKANNITALTQSFRQAIATNRLLSPPDDNARGHYRDLAEADATHPATTQAQLTLATEMLKEARIALGRNDLGGSERWLAETRAIGYTGAELAAVTRDLAAARTGTRPQGPAAATNNAPPATNDTATPAAAEARVVAANTLETVRFVAPRYPAAARARGQEGWVDIEFTVTTNGVVNNAQVVAAEPNGVFEDSALDAVRRWRYKPVMQNGTPVEQRAKLRIRFNSEE